MLKFFLVCACLVLALSATVSGQQQQQRQRCPEKCRKAKFSGHTSSSEEERPQLFYYYNNSQRKCKAFYYFGTKTMSIQENRFISRRQCDMTCTQNCAMLSSTMRMSMRNWNDETIRPILGKNMVLENDFGVVGWGKWGKYDKCPEGQYFTAIQIRRQWRSVDSDINGIRLYCTKPGSDVYSDQPVVSYLAPDSTTAIKTQWGQVFQCDGLLKGIQFEKLGNLAPTNLRAHCSGKQGMIQLDGPGGGTYQPEQNCFNRQALCAMQLSVDEGKSTKASWANLIQMKMECCDIPNSAETCVPSDHWDVITSFDNLGGLSPKKYTYKQVIGIGHGTGSSESNSKEHQTMLDLGFSVGYEGFGLSANFETKIGQSTTTGYTWSKETTNQWKEETSHEVSYEVPAKTKTKLSQVVGRCGDITIKTVKFKAEDTRA